MDRFKALNINIRGKSFKTAFCLVILVDLTSLLLMIPYAWNMKGRTQNNKKKINEIFQLVEQRRREGNLLGELARDLQTFLWNSHAGPAVPPPGHSQVS